MPKFDDGKSILEHLDLAKARRPNQEQKRVNVDFPIWMIQSLDKSALFAKGDAMKNLPLALNTFAKLLDGK